MIRKLASVRRVKEIKPIEGADAIELAFVDGWQCVVKKDQLKKGDLALYCEIDSFLPEKPEFEFLRKGCFKTMADGSTGFRLRTITLRKQLSQGLLLPLTDVGLSNCQEGDDVTEILEIKKYEPPIPACLAGEMKGAMPGFIRKTDQERLQNLLEYFDKYRDLEFEETEKLDGSSMTVYYNQGETGVCGREWEYRETIGNSLWNVSKGLELLERLIKLNSNIALQGEIIGEGIQSNIYKLSGQRFKIYDIWDIDHQYYLTNKERLEVLEKLGLSLENHVPILRNIKIFQKFHFIEEFLEYAAAESVLNSKTKREGIVFKSNERVGPQIVSFKVIDNKELAKKEAKE
jgi:RNA ligase (TIGR02306 family)